MPILRNCNIKDRIERIKQRDFSLTKEGFNIEAFYLQIGMLEHSLKTLASLYEEMARRELARKDILFNTKYFKLTKMTLGQLKNYLSVYLRDLNLLNEIAHFNKIRVTVIHKLYEKDINELNALTKENERRLLVLICRVGELIHYLQRKLFKKFKNRS